MLNGCPIKNQGKENLILFYMKGYTKLMDYQSL